MKKIFYLAFILTLIGFIPILHQELTGCNTFGWSHLISPAVTSPDECLTLILVIPLIPSTLLSILIHFDSVYINYFFLAVTSILIYTGIGYIFTKVKKHNTT